MFKKYKNLAIFTSQEAFKNEAKDELLSISNNGIFERWLNENIGVIKFNDNYEHFAQQILDKNLIFTRHIQSVNFILELNNDNNDIINLIKLKKQIFDYLNLEKSVSIQIRLLNDFYYKKSDILNALNDELIKNNFNINNKNPEQIISILLSKNECFIGISEVKFNLSKWSGGETRYSENGIICRSALKLQEILEHINIDLSKYKTALDLGCAPGGWSKVLVDNGLKVIGIDPGDVDEKLKNNSNFYHFKGLSEAFLEKNKQHFDVITNDMKMDYKLSISVINGFKKFMNKNGIIIMTIKLYKMRYNKIENIINSIKSNFNIIFARQLFYNRNEFSLVFKLKNNEA